MNDIYTMISNLLLELDQYQLCRLTLGDGKDFDCSKIRSLVNSIISKDSSAVKTDISGMNDEEMVTALQNEFCEYLH